MIGAIDDNSTFSRSPRATAGATRGTDFAALMADRTTSSAPTAPTRDAVASPSTNNTRLDDALAAFRKEASMTREERVRRDVLKAMELTEEAIDAMPPKEQKAVEDKIAAEVARRIRVAEDSTSVATPPRA